MFSVPATLFTFFFVSLWSIESFLRASNVFCPLTAVRISRQQAFGVKNIQLKSNFMKLLKLSNLLMLRTSSANRFKFHFWFFTISLLFSQIHFYNNPAIVCFGKCMIFACFQFKQEVRSKAVDFEGKLLSSLL